jgi:hypothetical protein
VIASECSGITSLLRNSKQYNHLSYISFKTDSCATIWYTSASYWKGVGNIHILWQPFQLLRSILTDVSSITKRRASTADLSPATGKSQLQLGQESMGNAPELSHCSLLTNPWPKQTGVLEHCHEAETNDSSPFFGMYRSDRIPKAIKDSNVHFFIHNNCSSKLLVYHRIPGTFWS